MKIKTEKKVILRQEKMPKKKISKSNLGQVSGELRREVKSVQEAGGLVSIRKRKQVSRGKKKMRPRHLGQK